MKLVLGFVSLVLLVIGRMVPAFAADANAKGLAAQAKSVLQKNCYACHGDGGFAESDFYALDHASLVPNRVKPGKPEESPLLKKVRSGEMPKDAEPLGANDQKILDDWIRAGAPNFNEEPERKFIGPTDVAEAIAADLKEMEEADRPFARYFTITHLYNAGLSDDHLETYRGALSKLANSLSWRPEIVGPAPIDREKTILRIDLRRYKWSGKIWDAIVAANPYGLVVDSKSAKFCVQATGSEQPVVRADWFVFAASRPPLYYEILQLPETDSELEKALQVDVVENIRTRGVDRAGFTESGVSENNRLIERHESELTRGAYWKSYDFANSEGKKSILAHPLGPKGSANNPFDHDGGEIIFNLPNGLQAYLLVDGTGNRIEAGPLGLVHDDSQKGRAVVAGISCMSCHVRGIISKQDVVRAHVDANAASFKKEEIVAVRALYPPAEKLTELQRLDAVRFMGAVEKTGVRIGQKDPIVTLSKRFEANLNAKLAAAEVGLPVDKFLTGLNKSPTLARTLGLLKVEGQSIKRDVFEEAFGTVVRTLRLGTFRPSMLGSFKAFRFDGKSRIETPLERISPVSLETWVYPLSSDDPAMDKAGRFVMGSDIKFKSGIGILCRAAAPSGPAKIFAQYLPRPNAQNEVGTGEPILPLNSWSHIAAVFGDRQTVVFLNGKEVARGEATQKTGGTRFAIGCAGEDNLNHYFVGLVRSVRISTGERYTQEFEPPASFEPDGATMLIYDANRATDGKRSPSKKNVGPKVSRKKSKGATVEPAIGVPVTDLSGKKNHGILHGVVIVDTDESTK